MKISIITICFNAKDTIADTIKSVIGQKNIDLEYIIIDGGSNDGTLDLLNIYRDKITTIISEPDNGIYDAMNKGIKMATGEIVGILNSDDFYYDENVLAKIVEKFAKEEIDACYGDIIYVDKKNIDKIVRKWEAGEYNEKKIKSGWIPPHPAFFCKRSVYQKIGLYRTDMKLAADYEFMLRCLLVNKIKISYLNNAITFMRNNGASSSNLNSRILGWRELKQSWIINNQKVPFLFIFRRVMSKIPQFFKQ